MFSNSPSKIVKTPFVAAAGFVCDRTQAGVGAG
jgi:hypothetical protein